MVHITRDADSTELSARLAGHGHRIGEETGSQVTEIDLETDGAVVTVESQVSISFEEMLTLLRGIESFATGPEPSAS
jgi:hypothetical protein